MVILPQRITDHRNPEVGQAEVRIPEATPHSEERPLMPQRVRALSALHSVILLSGKLPGLALLLHSVPPAL